MLTHDRPATCTSKARKRQQYACLGYVSFDERSHKRDNFFVDRCGPLGVEGSIDHLAARAGRGNMEDQWQGRAW